METRSADEERIREMQMEGRQTGRETDRWEETGRQEERQTDGKDARRERERWKEIDRWEETERERDR